MGPSNACAAVAPRATITFGLTNSDFSLEPGTASRDFAGIGFLMNAAFSAGFPFEMFDNIGDVSLRTIDTGFVQRIVKKSAGGADKRFAREIFFVAWLFADENDG